MTIKLQNFNPSWVVSIIHEAGVTCQPFIDKTLDGGTCIIFEDASTSNELTFIISDSWRKCYFAAIRDEKPRYRDVGEVRGAGELKILADWFMGGMLLDGEVV